MSAATSDDLLLHVAGAVAAVMARDGEKAADHVDAICAGGPCDIYAAFVGWAETARLIATRDGGPVFAVLEQVGEATPGETFAARFVAAHVNGDADTTFALFLALDKDASPDDRADAIFGLLSLAATCAKELAS